VVAGSAVAETLGGFRFLPALAALIGALLIQIACNLSNDLFDFRAGADGNDRLGPPRATASGWLSQRQIVFGIVVTLSLASCAGAYLIDVAGWPVVVIGVSSVCCALAYTTGPYPLAYHGLGEIFVFLFFGPVAVCGTTYVQTGIWSSLAFWAACPLGMLAAAILVVNNLRDRHSDARSGKRTLAVRWGARWTRVQYATFVIGSYVAVLLAVVLAEAPMGWLMVLVTLPLSRRCVREVYARDGVDLNGELGATARLGLFFGLLLAGGGLLWV